MINFTEGFEYILRRRGRGFSPVQELRSIVWIVPEKLLLLSIQSGKQFKIRSNISYLPIHGYRGTPHPSPASLQRYTGLTHLLSFAGVLVRVVFQCEFPVSLFELLWRGLGANTQQIVVGCFVDHGVNLANTETRC